MGYQEVLRPIEHLAESMGIKRAIKEYENNPHLPEYCCYACTARERATGRLYACIVGQRCRVTLVAGTFLDDRVPYGAEYSDYYEDLDEALVEAAAKERPDLVEKAYRETVSNFERGVEHAIERENALHEKALQFWPRVAKLLLAYGPMSRHAIALHPVFKGCFMWNILVELERQGLVISDGDYARDALRLSQKALKELGVAEMPGALTKDELIVRLLSDCGPLSSTTLSGLLDTSTAKVLSMLHRLMDEGRVAPVGRGRARKYRACSQTDGNEVKEVVE